MSGISPDSGTPALPTLDTRALSDLSKFIHASTLGFLGALLYTTLTALNITDENIFYADSLSLPIVKIAIPFQAYVYLTPPLILALHVFLLLQHYLLCQRLAPYSDKVLKKASQTSLMPSLPLLWYLREPEHFLPRFFVYLSHTGIFVVLPVATQALLLLRFYAFHDPELLFYHKLFLVATAFTSLLLILLSGGKPTPTGIFKRRIGCDFRAWAGTVPLFAFYLLAFYFLPFLPASDEDCESAPYPKTFYFLGFSHDLDLSRRILLNPRLKVEKAKTSRNGGPSGLSRGEDETRDSAGRADSRLLFPITKRDLTCANFSGSEVVGIEFRGVDLSRADFRNSRLERINFFTLEDRMIPSIRTQRRLKVRGKDEEAKQIRTSLRDAHFEFSHISNVAFDGSAIVGTNFNYSELHDVFMSRVDGRGGDFRNTKIYNSNFEAADLSFGLFRSSKIWNSKFRKARLLGALLIEAELFCPNLEKTDLRGAFLDHSRIVGGRFNGAVLKGSSYTGAKLVGVLDFDAKLVSLRGSTFVSHCGSIDPGGLDQQSVRRTRTDVPFLVDIMDARTYAFTPASLAALVNELRLESPSCLDPTASGNLLGNPADSSRKKPCFSLRERFDLHQVSSKNSKARSAVASDILHDSPRGLAGRLRVPGAPVLLTEERFYLRLSSDLLALGQSEPEEPASRAEDSPVGERDDLLKALKIRAACRPDPADNRMADALSEELGGSDAGLETPIRCDPYKKNGS